MYKDLIQNFLKSGLGVILSAVFGLLLLRLIAIDLGVEGIAKFGIYRQFIQFCTVFLSWGNGFSIIESYAKAKTKDAFTSVAFKYFQVVTILLSIIIAVLAKPIAIGLFDDENATDLILISPLIFIGLSNFSFFRFLLAARKNILSSGLLQALPFLLMIGFFFISKELSHFFIFSYAVSALASFMVWKLEATEKLSFDFSLTRMTDFEKTSIATIITGAVGFFCPLIVKSISVHHLGLDTSGVIEAEFSIVSYFTLAIISGLGTFYLGHVSEKPQDINFREKIFLFLIPLTSIGLIILVLFQKLFLTILFGEELLRLSPDLAVFSMGEMLRCINWFFIFTMIGLSYRKTYITFDILANISYILASWALVSYAPVRLSIEYGYFIFQLIYLLFNLGMGLKVNLIRPRVAFPVSCASIGLLVIAIYMRDYFHG